MNTRCDTTLVVTADPRNHDKTARLVEFQQAIGGEHHQMNLATLVPEAEPGNTEWRLKNWGTTEEIELDYVESDVIVAGEYYLRFFSVDTPIVPWVKTVAKLFPDLEFSLDYFNSMLNFEGELDVKGEKVIYEEHKEISANRNK